MTRATWSRPALSLAAELAPDLGHPIDAASCPLDAADVSPRSPSETARGSGAAILRRTKWRERTAGPCRSARPELLTMGVSVAHYGLGRSSSSLHKREKSR